VLDFTDKHDATCNRFGLTENRQKALTDAGRSRFSRARCWRVLRFLRRLETGGKRSMPLPASTTLNVDMVERDRVLEDDLPSYLIRYAREVALDDLARLGPGRIRMREVGRPHVIGRPK
jgi:hypothetical protein